MNTHPSLAICRLAVAISLALCAAPALALDTDWQSPDGDWLVLGNWSNGVPTALDRVRIDNGGIARITAANAFAQELIVGDAGTGVLTLTSGATLDAVSAVLGHLAGSRGELSVLGSGSALTLSDSAIVGDAGEGVLRIDDGARLSVAGGAGTLVLANAEGSVGTLNIGGASAGVLDLAQVRGGAGLATLNFDHGDSGYDVFAHLGGSLAVNHLGAGTTVLHGDHDYTGDTQVLAGRLLVEGGIASNTWVGEGGTLGGTGIIAGVVTVADGGILAPGRLSLDVDVGRLTMGGLVLSEDALLRFDLDAADGMPGIDGDAIHVMAGLNGSSGDLVLDGVLDVNALSGFGRGSYRLIDFDGALVDNGLRLGDLPGTFDTRQFYIQTGVNGQVNLIVGDANGLQFWDGGGSPGDGAISGGSGVWDNGNHNFATADGQVALPWLGTMAVFNGEGGTVTLGDDVRFDALQFAVEGYTVAADAGGQFGLQMDAGIHAIRVDIGSARIDAAISGEGILEKTFEGTLVLTGDNTYSGGTLVSNGVLRLDGGSISHAQSLFEVAGDDFDAGAFAIVNGGSLDSLSALIAEGTDSSGAVSVTGAGSRWSNGEDMTVGFVGNGSLDVVDGGRVDTGELLLGERAGSSGALTIAGAGSVLRSVVDVVAGQAGAAQITLRDGGLLAIGDGTGTLRLATDGGSARLTLGAGGDAGVLDAAALVGGAGEAELVFDHNQSSYLFDVAMSGDLAVTLRGSGTTTFSADSDFNGVTTVNAGRLLVDGALTSATVVNNGAILGGSGQIGALTLNAGARLAPGTGVGTLTVAGDAVFNAGSVFAVDVNADGSGDRLDVTGTAQVNGGAVQALTGPGQFAYRTRYTLIDADGGLSGQFASVSDDLAFFDSLLEYDGNHAFLVLQRNATAFGDVAQTFNQSAVADTFDVLQDSDPTPILDVIDAFANVNGDVARAGLEQVSGDAAAQSASLRLGWEQRHFARILSHLDAVATGDLKRRFWARAEGDSGSFADRNAGDADYDSAGITIGYDSTLGERWLGGYSLGWGRLDGDVASRAADLREDSLRASVYGGYRNGAWSLDGVAGLGFGETDIARDVKVGEVAFGRARGRADNHTLAAAVQARYTFALPADFTLTPLLAVEVTELNRTSFREHDAGAANLAYAGLQHTSLRSRLGFSANGVITVGDARLLPRASLAWQHEYLDRTLDQDTAFAAIDDSRFRVRSARTAEDSAVIGIGLDVLIGARLSWFFDLTGTTGSGDEDYAATAGMRYRF